MSEDALCFLQTLNLGLLKDDVQNFVSIVEGYYRIFVDADACLVEKPASKQTGDPDGKYNTV